MREEMEAARPVIQMNVGERLKKSWLDMIENDMRAADVED